MKKEIHKPFYENLLTEYILRPISNNLSYFLFKYFKGITANMVTGFSLIICILFGILFIFSNNYEILWIIGSMSFIFFIGTLLDYFLCTGYIKVILFLLLGFSVIYFHITTFIKLLKLK